jgi:hypothetical protein
MNAATASEIARLKTLTITQIVRQFESLFGEKCRSKNKRYLIRRIAWRLQANAEGDLSERAKARAAELALDSEVRVTPPRETIQPRLVTSDVQSRPASDQRLPPSVSMLHRDYMIDDKLLGRYDRFVNRNDMVPRIPPSYRPCGRLVWFTDDGLKRSKRKLAIFVASPNHE